MENNKNLTENFLKAEKEAEILEINGEFDENAELRAYEEEKLKASGCKFCKETNCIVNHTIDIFDKVNKDIKKVTSLVRFDSRPDDGIFQIDVETIYIDKDGIPRGGFSDNCVDINFCPVCGRNLREEKEKNYVYTDNGVN